MRCEDADAGPVADDLQLGDRARALQVARHQQRGVPLTPQPIGQFAGQRGLARALQTGQHDHRRRSLGECQPTGFPAEDPDQFLVDDLDDLLGRVQGTRNFSAAGALLDPADELAHHRQRYVGLQQSQPDLPGRRVDIGVSQTAFAA